MPGAERNIPVTRDIVRGMRRPQHLGYSATQPYRFIRPLCAAPVRPGETLEEVDMLGETMLDSVMQLQNLPLTWAEAGLWYVPITRLPQWFKQIFIGSQADYQSSADIAGTTAPVAAGANATEISEQGHMTPGLQSHVRPWAGEIGGNQTTQIAESLYAPYVSHATWAVAGDWYSVPNEDFDENQLFQNEPLVDDYVKSATLQNFDVGLAGLDLDPSSITSVADLLESMYLLTSVERTWAEYLAEFGVSPSSVEGMVHPIMLRHQYLGPTGSPQLDITSSDVASGTVERTGFSNTDQAEQHYTVSAGEPAATSHWDARALGFVGTKWDAKVRPRLRFDQPGILLGTLVCWNENGNQGNYGHHFDITRLTHPGHWGARLAGGVEEDDFIATQDLYDVAGTAIQDGNRSSQGGGGSSVMNMLNLFLHGDVAAPNSTDFFRFRGPYGRILDDVLTRPSTRMSYRFKIRSDLVA